MVVHTLLLNFIAKLLHGCWTRSRCFVACTCMLVAQRAQTAIAIPSLTVTTFCFLTVGISVVKNAGEVAVGVL